MLIWIC